MSKIRFAHCKEILSTNPTVWLLFPSLLPPEQESRASHMTFVSLVVLLKGIIQSSLCLSCARLPSPKTGWFFSLILTTADLPTLRRLLGTRVPTSPQEPLLALLSGSPPGDPRTGAHGVLSRGSRQCVRFGALCWGGKRGQRAARSATNSFS